MAAIDVRLVEIRRGLFAVNLRQIAVGIKRIPDNTAGRIFLFDQSTGKFIGIRQSPPDFEIINLLNVTLFFSQRRMKLMFFWQ
jgi:hypothetical protein